MNPDIPHIEQYSGVWAMYQPALEEALARIQYMDMAAHIAESRLRLARDDAPAALSKTEDGIATIEIVGTMTKFGSSFSSTPGSVALRKEIREVTANDAVRGIFLLIDSPGGSVAGTADLAQEVARARAMKPVTAFVQDLGASAAFWVASQATRVVANDSALVGSIGAFTVLSDFSKMFEEAGVKVRVIRSGEFKGAGVPGTEITDAQLAEFQRVIDSLGDLFVAAVAKGRGMGIKMASKLADGRIHVASAALSLKLIDAVETFDEAMAALIAEADKRDHAPAIPVRANITKGVQDGRKNRCRGAGLRNYRGSKTGVPQQRRRVSRGVYRAGRDASGSSRAVGD